MRMGEARKVVKKWVMRKAKRKLDALEMGILRSMCQLSLRDRIRNEEVRRRAGVERKLSGRVDHSIWRGFGHVERMDEECFGQTGYEL